MSETLWQGSLGERAFEHRATEEGLEVAMPCSSGCRYDAIADNGQTRWLVQVKTTNSLHRNTYRIKVARSQYQGARRWSKKVPYKPYEVHFIAVYLIPEKTFYILPLAALRGKTRLTFYSAKHKKKGPWAEYREAWHLFWPSNLDRDKTESAVNAVLAEEVKAP